MKFSETFISHVFQNSQDNLRKSRLKSARGRSVTASSGTAISTDFATLTCSEILSKILIRCVTWH